MASVRPDTFIYIATANKLLQPQSIAIVLSHYEINLWHLHILVWQEYNL